MLNWKSGKPINGRTAAAIAERIAPQATVYAADYTNLLVRRGITQPDITPQPAAWQPACGHSPP